MFQSNTKTGLLFGGQVNTTKVITNYVTVVGEDATGTEVEAIDCWTVILFQWQPRTIGYWGNWDNHYTTVEWESIRDEALLNSPNLFNLAEEDWYGEGNVHDFLLGKPPIKPKDGKDAYARFIMEKQFLATWLNVKAYWDWTGELPLDFPGTADVGMDPNAIVYLTGFGMPEGGKVLFGTDALSVIELLRYIEVHKVDWFAEDFGIAYEVLDIMNNAENNGYLAFMDPTFAPSEICPDVSLDLTKTAGVDEAAPGETITYTYLVENTGNVTLFFLTVTDNDVDDPPGITGPTEVSGDGDALFEPDEIWEFTASFAIPTDYAEETVDNTATAEAWWYSVKAEDSASESVDVIQADLRVVKDVDDPVPFEEDVVRFTITVYNDGPSDATGVEVDDLLPTGVTYADDGGGGAYTHGTGVWVIGDLSAGSDVSLWIDATVDTGTTEQTITNEATVTGNEHDPDEGNNTDDADIVPQVEETVVERWPEEGNAYIGYEDWTNGDFDYNDFGMNMTVEEWYEDDVLTEINMTFEAVIYDSGADHYIHIARPLTGGYSYDVTRSGGLPWVSGEVASGTGTSGSGDFDVVLYKTSKYPQPWKPLGASNPGETVTIRIYDFDTANAKPSGLTPPRSYDTGSGDFYDLDPFFALYDPWEDPFLPSWIEPYDWHIEDTQVVSSTASQKHYPAGEQVAVNTEVPMILVIPYTSWIPPYEDTTITGVYPYFNDFYTSADGSPSDWYDPTVPGNVVTNTVGQGDLSWGPYAP